jgi:putative ABC transport system substrate-binding protein
VKRREFITIVGGAAVALPLAARAQPIVRTVGILLVSHEGETETQQWFAALQQRLGELGWGDRNIRFERRWAGGDPERIRANIADVARLNPDVILAQTTLIVAEVHKQITSVPVVFVQVSDPIGDGFVKSLARPGGNLTGFTNTMSSLGGKWLELLREAVPTLSRVGYLINRAASPGGGAYYMDTFQSAATTFRLKTVTLELEREDQIEALIASFVRDGGDGIVADSDAFITVNRKRIIAAVNRLRLPTVFYNTFFVTDGGLLSYGIDYRQQWRTAASYVDRILRGEKPQNLPVQQPTNFELAINLKTAKAIGVTVLPTMLTRADKVIE